MSKVLIDTERHTVKCPNCAHRFPVTVRVYQAIQRVIVNKVVDLVTRALSKELGPKARALGPKIRAAVAKG